jgi:hypothetical protein
MRWGDAYVESTAGSVTKFTMIPKRWLTVDYSKAT